MGTSDLYSTKYLDEQLRKIDGTEAFKKTYLAMLEENRKAWQEKISSIIFENGYSKATLADLCGVSRTAVSKWCSGSLPQHREDYIRIGFAAHYGVEEMNRLLQRYGKYSGLYSKSLEDSVCIFVLSSPEFPHTYACYLEVLDSVKAELNRENTDSRDLYSTVQMSNELRGIRTIQSLTKFINAHATEYQSAYHNFYKYVDSFLKESGSSFINGNGYSVNYLAKERGWSSSLQKCVYAIRGKEQFPLRRKVIALGIHLSMTRSQIDKMLELAQMEKLCVKNPVESAIIFVIDHTDVDELRRRDAFFALRDKVRNFLEELQLNDAAKLIVDLEGEGNYADDDTSVPSKHVLTLNIDEQGQTRKWVLDNCNRWKLGRATSENIPDIILQSPIAGRIHGEFYPLDEDWYYVDLGSLAGTYLNGRQLSMKRKTRARPVPLHTGDLLQIDNTNLKRPSINGVRIRITIE